MLKLYLFEPLRSDYCIDTHVLSILFAHMFIAIDQGYLFNIYIAKYIFLVHLEHQKDHFPFLSISC